MAVSLTKAHAQDHVSLTELGLYHQIMSYRATLGLDAIPLSKALSATAGRHAVDTRENIWAAGLALPAGANLHSWSNAPYYADHRSPQTMWNAPTRLGLDYTSPGFEISAAGQATTADALKGWIGSPGHNAILAQLGSWSRLDFNAIGIGVETAPGAGPYGGRIYHVWFGQAADDAPTIVGTAAHDVIWGTGFSDRIGGGGGNDLIRGGNGNDVIWGNTGRDRLLGGNGNDVVNGGSSTDRIYGQNGNDRLFGAGGNDLLVGGNGDDRLVGDTGDDRLVGGAGRDVQTGGAGADVFIFSSSRDSVAGRHRDIITDFEHGRDRIDLSAIDARQSTVRDDAFVFIGPAAFGGREGQLRHQDGLIEGDVNGDRVADFQILLMNAGPVGSADFIL